MDQLPKTKEGLLELRLQLQSDIDAITAQVNEAKRSAAAGEGYGDRAWFQRAENALRHKGRTIQRIQLELSKLKRQHSGTIESAFMAAARDLLLPETFQNVMDAAHERLGGSR